LINTTDATPTVAAVLQTESDKVYIVSANAVCVETVDHSKSAGYVRLAAFKNDGGTLAQIGATAAPLTVETDGAWDFGLSASGTEIRATVTGAAATNINWRVDLTVTEVT
jgi:hypothetical protein